ncbi:MAG TPA: glycosyltransferase family 2 protein [Chloroflexota bacterium]|nr:glycosyltransferase family 2 protein [Chloroflexota bacterium]
MERIEEEMKPYLSVIIPAYNEEERIGKTLTAVYAYLIPQPYTWELLVILDGCQDNTAAVIESFAQGKENIRWIDRRQNRGKGYTVREGMLAAKGEIRLFTDADNSTDMNHFDRMKPLFDQGQDVVICSRDKKDAADAQQATPQPFHKRLMGDAGNLFIQVIAVPGIWDTQCGFKAFRAKAAAEIFTVAQINGWLFDIEALALARHFGYKINILGANWVDEPNTHVTFTGYIKSLIEALKVRWNLWTGAYKRPQSALNDVKPSQAKQI